MLPWCGRVGDSPRSPVRFDPCYSAPESLVVTCAQCLEQVLGADRIGDDEECTVRDHLLAVHPKTLQPETRSVLLRYFVVTEGPPPAA